MPPARCLPLLLMPQRSISLVPLSKTATWSDLAARFFRRAARKVRILRDAGSPIPAALLAELLEWSRHTFTIPEWGAWLLRVLPLEYREPPPPAAPLPPD